MAQSQAADGAAAIAFVFLMGLLITCNLRHQVGASSPLNLPPAWGKANPALGFGKPTWDHPLGTESSGSDMPLAVLIVGSPRSLRVGMIAAGVGVLIGVVLGFVAGFMGGWDRPSDHTLADAVITIPALAVLIVSVVTLSSRSVQKTWRFCLLRSIGQVTRLIRARVLTLRERGYVQMARLSGASTFDIMFKG